MTTRYALLAGLLAMLAMPVAARAGYKSTDYAGTDGSSYGYGSIGDARNSGDANQYIGCDTFENSGGTMTSYCYARNSAGTSYYCYSTDPNFVATASTITESSYIDFDGPVGGVCTYIQVSNYSYFRPMTP